MKTWIVSFKFILLLTLITGFVYPGLLTLLGQLAFPFRVNGSVLHGKNGEKIGSEWIAQNFKSPRYFWPRPSAIDFNPIPSGGSNLGPTSSDLLQKVRERAAAGATEDLLFASASGLDPHISPMAAISQAERVAKARGMPMEKIRSIVDSFIEERQWGFLGEPRVNVLKLNQSLDER